MNYPPPLLVWLAVISLLMQIVAIVLVDIAPWAFRNVLKFIDRVTP